MLSTILSMFGGQIVERILGAASDAFRAYQQKQISEAELKAKVQQALLEAVREVEKAHAESIAKTYASFMQAAAQSPLMQRVWAAATLSQLVVLLWAQIGIPAVVALGFIDRYPSSGTTVDYAYLLLAGLLGLGAVTLRSGAGQGTLVERLKTAIQR